MPIDYHLTKTPANAILRSKYACSDEWTAAFLSRAQAGHLATCWDDQPFITPVIFWYDPAKREIYLHTNITGRLRANIERNPKVSLEACEMGKLLPSNIALGFAMQYESAVVFGSMRLLTDEAECKRVLYGLIAKYFPGMQPDDQYRPVTTEELERTAVFAIAIESWSGKRNWKEKAQQSPDWKPLRVRP